MSDSVTLKGIEPEKSAALIDVIKERLRQDAKWGEQNWDPQTYLSILMEEVGEAAKEANDLHWVSIPKPDEFGVEQMRRNRLRNERVQVTAVALAMVECLDRGKWKWPIHPDAQQADKRGPEL